MSRPKVGLILGDTLSVKQPLEGRSLHALPGALYADFAGRLGLSDVVDNHIDVGIVHQ